MFPSSTLRLLTWTNTWVSKRIYNQWLNWGKNKEEYYEFGSKISVPAAEHTK